MTRRLRPDLLVLDIMMPVVHGMDVLKRLKADPETRGVGVVMWSAKAFKPDVDAAREQGAYAFLEKPVDRHHLAATVREYFDRHAAQGEADATTPPEAATLETSKPLEVLKPAPPFVAKLDTSRGYVKLWGTRGSIPVTGPRYARHGGNTSCLEVTCGDQTAVIDAGSGIRDLGMDLLARGRKKLRLFVGHTHWDHIQGFPFFTPAYVPGYEVQVFGARGFGKDLEQVFRGQLDRDYFPVEMNDMAAKLTFNYLEANPVLPDGDHQPQCLKIHWEFMNHPGATVGFRIESGGRSIGYITDNEFLKGYLGPPEDVAADGELLAPFRKIIDLVKDVDLLIHEAQYLNEEYVKKIGWGHSSVSNACVLVKHANVKRWVVTHHDPMHDDDKLQEKLNVTKQILKRLGHHAEVSHAFDGMVELL